MEWVVVDASPINVLDATALLRFNELCEDLGRRGIRVVIARTKLGLRSFFTQRFVANQLSDHPDVRFATMREAVRAFEERKGREGVR